MDPRFPRIVEAELRRQGWVPSRKVPWSEQSLPGYRLFPSARAAVEEFAGLHLQAFGDSCVEDGLASSDIRIDPREAAS